MILCVVLDSDTTDESSRDGGRRLTSFYNGDVEPNLHLIQYLALNH